MFQVLVLIVVACVAAVLVGRFSTTAQWLVPVGAAMLIYLFSVIAWWSMLYFHVVSFNSLLARFQIYRTEGLLGGAAGGQRVQLNWGIKLGVISTGVVDSSQLS